MNIEIIISPEPLHFISIAGSRSKMSVRALKMLSRGANTNEHQAHTSLEYHYVFGVRPERSIDATANSFEPAADVSLVLKRFRVEHYVLINIGMTYEPRAAHHHHKAAAKTGRLIAIMLHRICYVRVLGDVKTSFFLFATRALHLCILYVSKGQPYICMHFWMHRGLYFWRDTYNRAAVLPLTRYLPFRNRVMQP